MWYQVDEKIRVGMGKSPEGVDDCGLGGHAESTVSEYVKMS